MFKVTETKGGIALPDRISGASADAVETPKALVYGVGPDVKQLKRGDFVIALASMGAWKIITGGQDLIEVREDDIAGVLIAPTNEEVFDSIKRGCQPLKDKDLRYRFPEQNISLRLQQMVEDGHLQMDGSVERVYIT